MKSESDDENDSDFSLIDESEESDDETLDEASIASSELRGLNESAIKKMNRKTMMEKLLSLLPTRKGPTPPCTDSSSELATGTRSQQKKRAQREKDAQQTENERLGLGTSTGRSSSVARSVAASGKSSQHQAQKNRRQATTMPKRKNVGSYVGGDPDLWDPMKKYCYIKDLDLLINGLTANKLKSVTSKHDCPADFIRFKQANGSWRHNLSEGVRATILVCNSV